MVKNSRSDEWLKLLIDVVGGQDPAAMTCPRDGRLGLQVLCQVLRPDDGFGYCIIRCPYCSHGAWLSRVAPPPSLISETPASEWPSTTFED